MCRFAQFYFHLLHIYIMSSQFKRIKNQNANHYSEQNPYFTKPNQSSGLLNKPYQKLINKASHPEDSPVMYASKRSNSKAKSQFNYSKSGNSAYTTVNLSPNIVEYQTQNIKGDLRKQNILLSRQIEKLEKQILRKDQQIIQMRTQVLPTKEAKTQLVQLYKALNFYEGKVKQLQNNIYKFREIILKNPGQGVTVENLNVLFEQLRRDNQQLSGRMEQTQFIKSTIQNNYNRLKTKYYESQRELSQFKRIQSSPLYQYYLQKGTSALTINNNKFNKLIGHLISKNNNMPPPSNMQLKQKQIINRQLEQRLQQSDKQIQLLHMELQKVSQQFDKIRIENQMLKNQIDEKNNQNTQLFKDYMIIKKSLKKIQSQRSIISPNRNQSSFVSTPNFKAANMTGSFPKV